jgi:methionine-rich copper-binding protein CopC
VRSTFPADGSTVEDVRAVGVRFRASLVTGLITVQRDGRAVRPRFAGLAPRNRARLQATFARPLPRGRYTVRWRARAGDGHPQAGTFAFRVR